jgi:hypothetical protein
MEKIEKSKGELIAVVAGALVRDLRKERGHDFHYILTILTPKNPFDPDPEAEAVTVSSIHDCKVVQKTMREMSEGKIRNV